LTQAAERELREEAGLELDRVVIGAESAFETGSKDSLLTTFSPLICVADSVQNHFAIAIVVLAKGDPVASSEAVEHRWFTDAQLIAAVQSGRVFPLNVPMIEAFLRTGKTY
jgi:8-oxo-dGTP pyrophosphatase MutT (NUDIX family)